jgi:hypothetical protein
VLAQLSALATDDPIVGGQSSQPAGKKGDKKKKAVVTSEELTPLGYHLSSLPVDPRIGKPILETAAAAAAAAVVVLTACATRCGSLPLATCYPS